MSSSARVYGFNTNCVHAGQEPDPSTGAVIPPISLSTTFQQSGVGIHKGYEYSRTGNPTRANLEHSVASLEGAKYGLAFASGSATTATIAHLFPNGHVISVNDVYGGTYRYFTKVAGQSYLKVDFVELTNAENVKAAVKKGQTKLLWIETPTNPTLRLVDIAAVSKYVKEIDSSIVVVVDNTFSSPYFQKPIALGADIVVHSMTKYLNGHSDAVMGIAVMNDQGLYERLKFLQNSIGAVPSPFDSYLVHRGIKTLALRMAKHAENALTIAKYLESRTDQVVKVIYPGLPSHPQHALAAKQMSGFGGMISFAIKGTLNTSKSFLKELKIFALAESLGGVESLAELPCLMTHGAVSPADRAALGISDTLIRVSVGIEDVNDLIHDIEQALQKSASVV